MWFDKKSWRLRRKIKDLQADLREAEKEGRYVLQDGLFFAELEDMGDVTMVVFGAADMLSSQEESVIRGFFERNGFTVHSLKIDRTQTHLAEVEIIPPSEMVRHIGRQLKAAGYKVVDDSSQETPSDLNKKIITLSGLVRSIVVLFCDRVQQLVAESHIKMNKEGNRLLHWLPRISAALRKKITPELEALIGAYFQAAYGEFYGHLGSGTSKGPTSSQAASPAAGADKIPSTQFSMPAVEPPPPARTEPAGSPRSAHAAGEQGASLHAVTDTAKAPPPRAASESDRIEIERLLTELDTAETIGRMYRKLVHTQPSRCVRNAQALLEEINHLFRATAACLLMKVPHAHGITIHAQAGKPLVWGEGGKEGFPISTSIVSEVIRTGKPVKSDLGSGPATESMMMNAIEAVAAAPVFSNGEIIAVLYVDRREGLQPFDVHEMRALEKVCRVFEEFPDLTLGLA
jgi:hypothetical protein